MIDGADRIRVELTDSRTFDAKVVGTDPASDLAVLKIDAQDLPTLPLGDSNSVQVGDVVLAIGNPLGVGQTVTMGIISAKGRATGVGDGSYEDFLQTDAADQPGQLGRRAREPARRARRHQLADPDADRRQHRPRLRHPVEHGAAGDGPAEGERQGQPRQAWRDDPEHDGGSRVEHEARRTRTARSSATSSLTAPRRAPDCGRVTSSLAVDGEKLADNNALRNRIAGDEARIEVAVEVLRDGKTQTLYATLDAQAADKSARAAGAENGEGEGLRDDRPAPDA